VAERKERKEPKGQVTSWLDAVRGVNAQRIKLGRGVVGKLTNIALAFYTVLAIAMARADNIWIQAGAVASGLIAFLFFVHRVTRFAETNPESALLEGAEFIALKKFQATAKGMHHLPPPKDTEPMANPEASELPQLVEIPTPDESDE
jgi:hypothetical protein